MKNLSILLLILILFTSCQQNHSNKKQQPIGLNLEFMDKSIRPQDDFYNFVNGEWMKNTKIPADRSR
jgi:putative endopeptidase